MNRKRVNFNRELILLFVILFAGLNVSAQNTDESISDSLRLSPVQLTDIPIRSAETLMQTRKILENVISDEEIAELKNNNDSILNIVAEENDDFFEEKIESKNIRFLENRILQLKTQKIIVENEKTKLSLIINDLDKSLSYLTDEQIIWTKTKNAISKSHFSGTIKKRIELILENLNSTLVIVSLQEEDMLSTLDRSAEFSAEMEVLLENLENSTQKLQDQLLISDYPSLFNLDYHEDNLIYTEPLKKYIISEWEEIKSYANNKLNYFIYTLILFLVLTYLFVNYRAIYESYQTHSTNYYKRRLGLILSKPISASLVLTLLATVLIFPNRPPAFRDLIIYLVVIPIAIIMRQLLHKKLLIFVYGFAALLLLNMIFIMLPPENVIYRFSIFFISLIEIFYISLFLFRTLPQLTFSKKDLRLFKNIGYFLFILSLIALLGSVIGNVMMAQKILYLISWFIVVGSIIYATLITINGLFISFMESKIAQKVNFIGKYGTYLKKKVVGILNAAAIFYVIFLILEKLTLWKSIKDSVTGFFVHQYTVGEIQFSIGSILIFFLVIYLSVVVGRIIQILLQDDILNRMSIKKGMPFTISMTVRYSLITIGVFLAISATGIKLSSLTVIIGAFGVGIGFGLQNIFNNLVSGLILLFDRPVKIGDTVEVGALIGKVSYIGIRSSNIKTFDGAEVIVPNGLLISNEVINWTLSDQQRRIEVIIGVSYDSDPNQVYEILIKVLDEHKEVMKDPKPAVLFNELGESSLDFRMLFWTTSYAEWLRIRSEITFKAFYSLKENDINIPFPQRDIHVKSIEQNPKISPSENKEE